MKIIPKKTQVLGRIADITKTKGGIMLPDTQAKGVTIFVLLDAVGPDVADYNVGDLVIPQHVNHIYLRNGHHQVIFDASAILAVAEGVPLEQLTIADESERASTAGAQA